MLVWNILFYWALWWYMSVICNCLIFFWLHSWIPTWYAMFCHCNCIVDLQSHWYLLLYLKTLLLIVAVKCRFGNYWFLHAWYGVLSDICLWERIWIICNSSALTLQSLWHMLSFTSTDWRKFCFYDARHSFGSSSSWTPYGSSYHFAVLFVVGNIHGDHAGFWFRRFNPCRLDELDCSSEC